MAGILNALSGWFGSIADEFRFVFIEGNRYEQMITGFVNTLKITFGALIIGIAIGIIVAAVRSTYDKNRDKMRRHKGIGYFILAFLNAVCKIYLTVIRGTPVVVQLMISYFLIFVSVRDGVPIGIFAFGINSGAYVAEIFRSGIMSIDIGQMEAGRSLGFNYVQTMWHIIIPQAFKNVLPTLGNQIITLLKETSVASFIAVVDLTKAFQNIANSTYEFIVPYLVLALFYLVLVILITMLIKQLEKRMKNS